MKISLFIIDRFQLFASPNLKVYLLEVFYYFLSFLVVLSKNVHYFEMPAIHPAHFWVILRYIYTSWFSFLID